MPANKELPDRRFPRRADFDYSSAAIYFVTVCTKDKRSLFGQIAGSQMLPNPFGKIVQETWHELPDHYPRVNLDCFALRDKWAQLSTANHSQDSGSQVAS